jgi:flagellar biosynthesis protein FliQ
MPVITSWGVAILTALTNALNLLLAFIPKFIGFLVILLVGWIIASVVSRAVTFLLGKLHFDQLGDRIGLTRFEQRMGVRLDTAAILGKVVYWFVFLIFLVPATDALGIPTVSNILNQLVAFIPNVFVAILVLFLGALAGTVVADLVRGATASANLGNPNLYAGLARWAIIGFAAIIALEQLQIAPAIMNVLFTAIVGALALAFGLAFGLGGRETAQRLLNRTESTMSQAANQLQAQQPMPYQGGPYAQQQIPGQANPYVQQQMAGQANPYAQQQMAGQANPYAQQSMPAQPGPDGQPFPDQMNRPSTRQ